MPIQPTYPGVYIEELPSGVRTIVGVSTSVTGFIGPAKRGPVDKVKTIFSYADYERVFGGLWEKSPMSYSVQQYFMNGGGQAEIVRVVNGASSASIRFPTVGGELVLEAISPGEWGNALRGRVDLDTKDDPDDPNLFNLKIKDIKTGQLEVHLNLSLLNDHVRNIEKVLQTESQLVSFDSVTGTELQETTAPEAGATDFEDGQGLAPPQSNAVVVLDPADLGSNGSDVGEAQITGSATDPKTGLFAFDEADIINLLCVPPYSGLGTNISDTARSAALDYAKRRRAIFIVDPLHEWKNFEAPDPDGLGIQIDENAALYFPLIKSPDSLQDGRLNEFVPSGAIAGLIARNDAERGVWKAPAGIGANLVGVPELSVNLTDQENGVLNPQGINCLRTFKGVGRVAWGARTLRGADKLADQWKYLPVRRLALFIEESLFRGSQWIVFEPNDEPLWAQIRLNMGAFMHNLFRQGAFQGTKPKDAYLVKCDAETTTQNDINQGIVNIVIGFAPLKPAEFVIIKIQQLAGQVAA